MGTAACLQLNFEVKWTGRGLVVKWSGVLSKVLKPNLVLGMGALSQRSHPCRSSR